MGKTSIFFCFPYLHSAIAQIKRGKQLRIIAVIWKQSSPFACHALAAAVLFGITSGASAATVRGTTDFYSDDNFGEDIVLWTSDNLTYTGTGADYADDLVYLFCVDFSSQEYRDGYTYNFYTDATGANTLPNGVLGNTVGVLNYVIENYFYDWVLDSGSTTADKYQAEAVQYLIWEIADDYDGYNLDSLDTRSGVRSFSSSSVIVTHIQEYWDIIVADLEENWSTVTADYVSTSYDVSFLAAATNGYQGLMAVVASDDVTDPVSAVPVPAGLPLALTGLAALGLIARQKRKSADITC